MILKANQNKVLGEVPADNLLRLKQRILVRFAGQIWRVRKISVECILVEPAQGKGNVLDFTYSGRGIGCDAFVCNRMWQIIHSEELPFDVLSPHLRESISETKNSLQHVCSFEQIPYNRSLQGIRYFTFGGYLVNKAVGLITRQLEFKADDNSLLVTSPIDWKSIPTDPQAYEPIFHLLFEVSSEQSIYQMLLPSELQLREFIQDWIKDETVVHVLSRLVRSRLIKIESNMWL